MSSIGFLDISAGLAIWLPVLIVIRFLGISVCKKEVDTLNSFCLGH